MDLIDQETHDWSRLRESVYLSSKLSGSTFMVEESGSYSFGWLPLALQFMLSLVID